MTDFFLSLDAAGAGDELQGLKKGVVEARRYDRGQQADGDNIARASAARRIPARLHILTTAFAGLDAAGRDLFGADRQRSRRPLEQGA